jgi:hypothetical protein
MHEDGEITIEYEPEAPPASDQDLLEAAIDEAIVRPNGTRVLTEEDEVVDLGRMETPPPETEPETPGTVPAPRVMEDAAAPTARTYPRLYPGGFTLVGLVFAILALLALAFTILMARYDTWVQGAAEESMGDNQLMLFYAGLLAFAVCILIAVVDLLRTPTANAVR